MSDTEAASAPAAEEEAPPAAPAPEPKKKKPKTKSKKVANHPKYREMTIAAIKALGERSGSSRQAIQKYIQSHYNIHETMVGSHLKMTLKACVQNGTLKQSKGTGASGSFKLGDKLKEGSGKKTKKPAAAAPSKKPKASKKKATKPKKTKPKAEKKEKSAKSSPKKKVAKPKKTKSPKKAASKPKAKKAKAAKK